MVKIKTKIISEEEKLKDKLYLRLNKRKLDDDLKEVIKHEIKEGNITNIEELDSLAKNKKEILKIKSKKDTKKANKYKSFKKQEFKRKTRSKFNNYWDKKNKNLNLKNSNETKIEKAKKEGTLCNLCSKHDCYNKRKYKTHCSQFKMVHMDNYKLYHQNHGATGSGSIGRVASERGTIHYMFEDLRD